MKTTLRKKFKIGEKNKHSMNIDWKTLSLSMIISFVVIWISSLIIAIIVIQPYHDIWSHITQYPPGSITIAEAENSFNLPNLPLWMLLIISLFIFIILTLILYKLIRYLIKREKKS